MGLFTHKHAVRIRQRNLGEDGYFSAQWSAAASITNDCRQDEDGNWWTFWFTDNEFESWKSRLGVPQNGIEFEARKSKGDR